MTPLPPFLFAAKTQRDRRWLARLKAEKKIRQIGPRLFTSLSASKVEAAARGGWATIVSGLFPGALVSHRTALEYVPSPEGVVFLTGGTNRRISYPGLTIEFVRGPGPLPDDPPFLAMHASSLPRAYLENLKHDTRVSVPRTVSVEEIKRRLERTLRDGGEVALNEIRDRARAIAVELGWNAELERLAGIIGALLGTRRGSLVTSEVAKARVAGEPYDTTCLERLHLLFGELRTRALRTSPDLAAPPGHFESKAFFESYFSNYIEGTRFAIEEAEAIVFEKKIPPRRPVDAHDIVGTFSIVSDPSEMRRTPVSSDALLDLLRSRHAKMLAQRPEVGPGTFKSKPNVAGSTEFVPPDYVIGTLKRGHDLYVDLEPGLQRAMFMMFLVADVHPFADGNGRIARIMMNAELVARGASTIIIPTVFRDDYLQALRALTRRKRPTPLIDALLKASRFSRLDFSSYPDALGELQGRNWFREPDDARIVVDE